MSKGSYDESILQKIDKALAECETSIMVSKQVMETAQRQLNQSTTLLNNLQSLRSSLRVTRGSLDPPENLV